MATNALEIAGFDAPSPRGGVQKQSILIGCAELDMERYLSGVVSAGGWSPVSASDGEGLIRLFREAAADLIVLAFGLDFAMTLEALDHVRRDPRGRRIPVVCVLPTTQDPTIDQFVVDLFARQADDVVGPDCSQTELQARFRIRIDRTPTPRNELTKDPVTGTLTPAAFNDQVAGELERVTRGGRVGSLGFLAIEELPAIEIARGYRSRDQIIAQIVDVLDGDSRNLDFVGFVDGVVGILLPGTSARGALVRFERLAKLIYETEFKLGAETVQLTPIIGFAESEADLSVEEFSKRAKTATRVQADQRDLHPTEWTRTMVHSEGDGDGDSRSLLVERVAWLRTAIQIVSQQLLLLGGPLTMYFLLAGLGIDVTSTMYFIILGALLITSILIVVESMRAVNPPDPPDDPDVELPLATAIIAAFLPNEAQTIVETVESFLRQDYPQLQIILAYNRGGRLDVEDELEAIAARDSRFEPLLVEGSVSKAQNVNAALARVRGEFVGMFDADHHPAPGSFVRAWRWIVSGVGVVQGHCVIRNGSTNLLTKLVAAEFEAIYAVSHPGRARLHGFGVFGGSNGYWRTSLLHRTRMRGFMLTEDIDSSMRVFEEGETIVSDPKLISTELAPHSARALWNQRMRWAQGWSQVSVRHLGRAVRRAEHGRQRFGLLYLLGWRELYPWLALQMVPLFGFWWLTGRRDFDWFIPIFVATSIGTFISGPVQVWYAWRLSHSSIGEHRRWFALLLVCSLLFYTEIKNVIARTAHIKELMHDRQWKVTPRSPVFEVATSIGAERSAAAGLEDVWDGLGSEAEADMTAKRDAPHNRRSTDQPSTENQYEVTAIHDRS